MTRQELEDELVDGFLLSDYIPTTKEEREQLFHDHNPAYELSAEDRAIVPAAEWADFVASVERRIAADYDRLIVLWWVKDELVDVKKMLRAVLGSGELRDHAQAARELLEQMEEYELVEEMGDE
jgi:hypothetical protein